MSSLFLGLLLAQPLLHYEKLNHLAAALRLKREIVFICYTRFPID